MIAFGFACWAVGDSLRKALFKESASVPALGRHALSFTAGNIALSYLLTVLGFAGLFYTAIFWSVFLGGVGMAFWRIIAGGSIPLAPAPPFLFAGESRGTGNQERWALIFLAAVIVLFLVSPILQAAAPPYVRDSLVYHLFCPKEYLKAGGLGHIEGNLYSAFPKGHEVLMTLLMAVAGDRAAQGFSVLQHLAAVAGIYSLSRMMAGPWAAALCAVGYATVPPAVYFAGCGYVEPALLMTLGAGLLALALLLHSGAGISFSGRRGTVFVGLLAGWMPALKYTGLIYLGLIGLILLWGLRKAPPKRVLTLGIFFVLAAIPGLCWMAWNWLALGNPVYPFAWFILGGKGWDDARARALAIYFDLFGMGGGPLDYLRLPWRLAFSGRFDSTQFDGAMGPFLIIFLIGAVASAVNSTCRRLMEGAVKGLGFALLASAAFFVLGTQQARFWLPTQMIACIYAAPAIELLTGWARKKNGVKVLLALIVGVSLAWNLWFLGKQFLTIAYYRPVLGLEQERAFLGRKVPGYPAIEFINTHLPKPSRILCVWTGAYGYYLNRPYYSDTFLEDVTLKRFIDSSNGAEELSQRLTQAGFSHLFVQLSLLKKNMEPRQGEVFGDFLAKKASELFRFKDYAVFAVCQN